MKKFKLFLLAVAAVIVFGVYYLFYYSSSILPSNVDKKIKNNINSNYTVQRMVTEEECEFLSIFKHPEEYTSYVIEDTNKKEYLVSFGNKGKEVFMFDENYKMVYGMLDDSVVSKELWPLLR